jgi:predicted RecB family nuclease
MDERARYHVEKQRISNFITKGNIYETLKGLSSAENQVKTDKQEVENSYIMSLNRWLPLIDEVILADKVLTSKNYRFSGKINLIVRLKGENTPSLIQIKLSKAFYPHFKTQLAAYYILAKENGYDIARTATIRLSSKGNFPLFNETTKSLNYDMEGFLAALKAYNYFINLRS